MIAHELLIALNEGEDARHDARESFLRAGRDLVKSGNVAGNWTTARR